MSTTGNPQGGETGHTGPDAGRAGPPDAGAGGPGQPAASGAAPDHTAQQGGQSSEGGQSGQSSQGGQSGQTGQQPAPGQGAEAKGAEGSGGAPLADYGYDGGYGYGPGYGDPDGGGDYSYGPGYAGPGPGYAGTSDSGSYNYGTAEAYGPPEGYRPPQPDEGESHEPSGGWGGAGQAVPALASGPGAGAGAGPVAYQPVPPVVAATPALRGYPGGPGLRIGDDELGGRPGREARGLSAPSVWQDAQKAWRESGIEWQRPVGDWEPAEAEWDRVRATPTGKQRGAPGQTLTQSPGAPGAKMTGRLPARTLGGLSSAALPGSSRASGPLTKPGAGRPAGLGGRSGGGAFRLGRGVWLTALIVIVVAALVVAGLFVFGPLRTKPHAKAGVLPFPPAAAAGADFATSSTQLSRGIFQSVSGVAAVGGTVVAVGYETGQWIPRAQFLVSTDGGHTWRLAPVGTSDGAAPPPTARPQLIAGGPGGWLALGTSTTWTSRNGTAWTLSSGGGIGPLKAGDHVLALARTSSDFVAVGHNGHSPVVWTSSNGQIWQRLGAADLHLAGSGQTVLDLRGVAAHGSNVIMDGAVTTTRGKGKHRTTSNSVGIWQSTDGGSTWVAANPPVTDGATAWVDGVAATGSGFVAIRPGSSKKTGSGAVVYTSPGGRAWTQAATLTAGKSAGLHFGKVGGSDQGAAAVGQLANGSRVAYVSTNGTSWTSVPGAGSAAQSPAQVTMTSGGSVVVGGSTTPSAVRQQPYLAVATGGHVSPVSLGSAAQPSLGVSGIATAASEQVAVGTANGNPAIWSATGRHWAPVSSTALRTSGLGTLTGVAHGGAGWVAVGGVVAGAPSRPLILTSADGTSWQPVASESAFAGQGITVRQAAAGPSGYVIIGGQVTPAHTVTTTTVTHHGKRTSKKSAKKVIPARTVSAAWWSSGLTGWTRGTGQLAGFGHAQMNAVTAGGPGYVVAGANGSTPAVWTSADGKQWTLTQVGPPQGATSAALLNVAAHGKVIVATGMQTTASGTAPFAEYSADGGTLWQPLKLGAPSGPAAITALIATGKQGFVAVGTVGQPGNQRVIFWTSANGSAWRLHEPTGAGLNGPGAQEITALATTRSGLIGVGFTATPLTEQPTLWTGTAGQPVSARP
ncbi:MAG TPA: hypothetical protein VGI74_22930 [Streptosporangiaceae bacterium]